MAVDLLISPEPALLTGQIEGEVLFAVEPNLVPEGGSIQYLINGRTLCGPLASPPYEFKWHTAHLWDGRVGAQAIVWGPAGELLERSPIEWMTVAHGRGNLTIVEPDLTYSDPYSFFPDPLSGVVSFELEGTRVDGLFTEDGTHRKLSFWVYFDGVLQLWEGGGEAPRASVYRDVPARTAEPLPGSRPAILKLDTTRFSNGVHDLVVKCQATEPDPDVLPPLPPGNMLQSPVIIENGDAVAEIRPRWREVYLTPGEKLPLAPSAVLASGRVTRVEPPPRFTSTNESVATVSDTGDVTAHKEGFADVRIRAGLRSATVPVIVDSPDRGFPHFSRGGKILSKREPGSLFVRSLPALGEAELRSNDSLTLEMVKAARINAWESAAFLPVKQHDLDVAMKAWHDLYWDRYEALAARSGMSFVLTGDDIVQPRSCLLDSITNPISRTMIQHALETESASGFCVCIEALDETTIKYGVDPVPAQNWETEKGESLDQDAFVQLMKIMNDAKDRPAVTWQAGGGAVPATVAKWMGDPKFSDYTSIYFRLIRHPYPYATCLDEERMAFDYSVVGWRPSLQRRAPMLLMISCMGVHYWEHMGGDIFRVGVDSVIDPGVRAVSCATEIMYAAAMGMAGIRISSWDSEVQKDARSGSVTPPKAEHQTGTDAVHVGTDRWQAIASASNLVERLEPYLLQPQVSAVHMGRPIVTGARRGPSGSILIAVNFSDSPRTATANLRPYRNGTEIARYRLCGATLVTEALSDSETDDIQFRPGEAVVWVFPKPALGRRNRVGPSVEITYPPPDATIAGPVQVRAKAGSNAERIDFLIDGRIVSRIHRPRRFETEITTAGMLTGVWHSVSAICYDGAGDSSEARIAFRIRRGRVEPHASEQLPMSLAPIEVLTGRKGPT